MKNLESKFYIGLMSGTSLDGIDASLIKTDGNKSLELIKDLHIPYHQAFKDKLRKLLELKNSADIFAIEKELTDLHIQASFDLIAETSLRAADVEAIGFHGQTIYHNPAKQLTCQIGNGFLLASATGIKVVSDFRKRDIAYKGQGAPLIPIFHEVITQDKEKPLAVINIGGVANITYIDEGELIAFDTGPGNALIDDACFRYFNKPYDYKGEIASEGKPNLQIIDDFLKKDYFLKSYPKSLDRNEFAYLQDELVILNPEDQLATLTHLTASAIDLAIKQLPKMPRMIYLCGGGSRNSYLTSLITILVSNNNKCTIQNIDKIPGLNPDFIESQGFAYLAARCVAGLPSAFPSTTGAIKENVCGVLIAP